MPGSAHRATSLHTVLQEPSSCTPAMAWRRQRPWESLKTHSHIDTKPPHQGSQEQPCALNQFKRQLLSPVRCKQHWLGLHSHLLWAHSEQPNPSVFSKREFSTWSSALGTASSKTLPPQPCQACNGPCRVSTSIHCASLPGTTRARSRSPALELQAGEGQLWYIPLVNSTGPENWRTVLGQSTQNWGTALGQSTQLWRTALVQRTQLWRIALVQSTQNWGTAVAHSFGIQL